MSATILLTSTLGFHTRFRPLFLSKRGIIFTAGLMIISGLVVLIFGAEVLVRSGTHLASRLGISPITIGLTVVAIGTSMPELAVGIDGAARGNPGLAVGNIVGTNLVNILLIMGLSALIVPIVIARRTLMFDLPVMAIVALAVYFMGRNGVLSTGHAWILLFLGVVYTVGVVLIGRREGHSSAEIPFLESQTDETPAAPRSALKDAGLLLLSLMVIVWGADLLVQGSVSIATSFGISDVVIGLTIVAIGTSAPELVTTLVSTFRGTRDIAIGNLIGSSVYNIAFVLAATTIVVPGDMPVPETIRIDLGLIALVSLVCVPVFLTSRRINRIEGALFVLAYCAYLTWLLTTRV